MAKLGSRRFSPELYPVQMTVSFPRILRDTIQKESKRLGITKSEYVRQCVIAHCGKSEVRKFMLEYYRKKNPSTSQDSTTK